MEIVGQKGKRPTDEYNVSLPEIFYKSTSITLAQCEAIVSKKIGNKNFNLSKEILGYRQNDNKSEELRCFSFAGPFQMKQAPKRVPFNLQYQDDAIKIIYESTKVKRIDIRELIETVSATLHTQFNEEPLYQELTNIELDFIVLKCLSWFQLNNRSDFLLDIGNRANEMANLVRKGIFSTHHRISCQEILPFLIFSGVIWWSKEEIQNQFLKDSIKTIREQMYELCELADNTLQVNDYAKFDEEVIKTNKPTNILYFVDDNGEMAFTLFFIDQLLEANKNLTVTLVINSIPITNNACSETLNHCIEQDQSFYRLFNRERFRIISELNELSAIDLRFCSSELKNEVKSNHVILVNGVSYFEKLQYLPVPTYYFFTVYSKTSQMLTGFESKVGIFVRIEPNQCGFCNIGEDGTPKKNLKRIKNL